MRAAAQRRTATDPTTAYAVDVVRGRVVVGRPVRWACERHLADLEHGGERGLYFDEEAAQDAFDFFAVLRHFEGELGSGEGQPFILEPWQQFVIGSVFGWKREDGSRRFREAWLRVARKNGKSFLAAGVGNLLLTVDGEAGAQIYSAATKRDQAKIIHRAAIAQRDKSPSLRGVVKKMRDRLVVPSTRSFFAPLGADSHTEDGLNPHGATLDEIHAHKDGTMWDVLESAMGARRQPLIFATTTAGTGAGSFGRQQDGYYRAVVDPASGVENDAAFVYIAELDEGDDPYDERVWVKANPNIDVSVRREFLRDRAAKAKQHPRFEADFFVKNLDMWIQSERRWLAAEKWDACKSALKPAEFLASLKGRPCYGALDLSSNTDLTAFVLLFPATAKGGRAAVLPFFFCPADNVDERMRRDRVDYPSWVRAGFIEATPGASVNQDLVKAKVKSLSQEFQFARQPLAIDRKFAEKLYGEMEAEGFNMRRYPQTYQAFTGATMELERFVEEGGIEHDGNPVLRWMAGNVVLKQGGEGDVMPSKSRSPDRIDGIVALLMALGTAGTQPVTVARPVEHHKVGPRGADPRRGGGGRRIYNVFR